MIGQNKIIDSSAQKKEQFKEEDYKLNLGKKHKKRKF